MPLDRTRSELRIAGIAAAIGVVLGLKFYVELWALDGRGFSLVSERLPYWDFSNLWGGSVMALKGHVGDIFDIDAYRATLRSMFSPHLPDQEWSYPPSILLLGLPLAAMPIFWAYLIWTCGTIALLYLATRLLDTPAWQQLAFLASPAIFVNATLGQNGALTASLLFAGLLLAPKRPIFAGVLLGILTIKPHLGVLVPFCLLASGNYRAILAASLTTICMVVASGLVFGFEVWPLFVENTRPLMTAIMEAPYPKHYHTHAMTAFALARSLGAGLRDAYVVQAAFSVTALLAVVWLWRPSTIVDHRTRTCLTAILTLIATPYGYTYDAIPLCIAAGWLFFKEPQIPGAFLVLAWLYPIANHVVNRQGISLGILVPAAVALWGILLVWHDQRTTSVARLLPARD